MRPDVYAAQLVKKNGKSEAVRITLDTKKASETTMMDANPDNWGTPLSDEVQVSLQSEIKEGKVQTRVVTVVDRAKKHSRIKKTHIFWTNVASWLKKRYPEEFNPTS